MEEGRLGQRTVGGRCRDGLAVNERSGTNDVPRSAIASERYEKSTLAVRSVCPGASSGSTIWCFLNPCNPTRQPHSTSREGQELTLHERPKALSSP